MQTIAHGLSLAAEMAWETWWALVLGFTIAGAVEAFVSESRLTRALGGSGPRPALLGVLFGAASSSCSFGAVATAKSLFKKGASAEASLAAFQFASTNLVIELGLVMWVLLGWQFVAANVVAGLMLIAMLVLAFRFVVPRSWFEQAREHARRQDGDGHQHHHDHGTGDELTFRQRVSTWAGWQTAFANAIGEWRMLWKDIVGGFLIAGLIAAFVPRSLWAALFGIGQTGTLTWVATSAVIGVVVGVATFVCSVGNVPFALILWHNGIPFGAVMSFIFSDLIVPPIADAYRRYYGWRMAATIVVTTAAAAVIAGVVIHYLWGALGLVPAAGRPGGTAPGGYTVYLNAIFTVLFAVELWAARRPAD